MDSGQYHFLSLSVFFMISSSRGLLGAWVEEKGYWYRKTGRTSYRFEQQHTMIDKLQARMLIR